MKMRVDQRTIRFERDDEALDQVEERREAWLEHELLLAHLFCRIDRKAAYVAASCASVQELASRRGYDGPRTRDLCQLGYALEAEPVLEELLRANQVGFPAACAIGRIYRDHLLFGHLSAECPLLEPEDEWVRWARFDRIGDLRRRIRQRIESARQQRPVDHAFSAHVTARTAEKIDRCRLVASQKAGRQLTNGQLMDVISTAYLLENDELEHGQGPLGQGPLGQGPLGQGPLGQGPLGQGPRQPGRGPLGRESRGGAGKQRQQGQDGEGQPAPGRPGTGQPGTGQRRQGQPGQGQPGQGQPRQGQPRQGQSGQARRQPGQGQPGQGQPGQGQRAGDLPGQDLLGQDLLGQGKPGQGKPGQGPQGNGQGAGGQPGNGQHPQGNGQDGNAQRVGGAGARRLPPTAERPYDRTIPAEVSRALAERSGGLCEFGSCDRPAQETCHLVPHRDGSGRELGDLVRGCRLHHKAFDAGLIRFLGFTRSDAPLGAGLPVFLTVETNEILEPKPRPKLGSTAGADEEQPEWLLRALGKRLRRRLLRLQKQRGLDPGDADPTPPGGEPPDEPPDGPPDEPPDEPPDAPPDGPPGGPRRKLPREPRGDTSGEQMAGESGAPP